MTRLQNKVQLIAYPDSMGNDLKDLRYVLKKYIKNSVGGVHILPFYPSSADRGFAPLTHMKVDHKFGDWDDIRHIAKEYDLIADLIANHVSSESEYFKDFLEKGDDSEYGDIFIDIKKFLKKYDVSAQSLRHTYRPRSGVPFAKYGLKDGSFRKLWSTWTKGQIDLNFESQKTKKLIKSFILNLAGNGVKLIRLDAIGYTAKRPNTTSFLIPETFEIIKWIKGIASSCKVELLAEAHVHYKKQFDLINSTHVQWVYDFALPMLVLHALYFADGDYLKNWLKIRPDKQITTLDTHDGIGVIDVKGLIPEKERKETVRMMHARGGKDTYRSSGVGFNNLDVYQVNCTYYSALGSSDDAYIAARAIQFFAPGIPQVYYVGLFAGENDVEGMEKTGHGRDINRKHYSLHEIERVFNEDVVHRLVDLMKFRNRYPAFNGKFTLLDSPKHIIEMRWDLKGLYCKATIHLQDYGVYIEYVDEKTGRTVEEKW